MGQFTTQGRDMYIHDSISGCALDPIEWEREILITDLLPTSLTLSKIVRKLKINCRYSRLGMDLICDFILEKYQCGEDTFDNDSPFRMNRFLAGR